jgi:hypothetical protein
MVFVQGASLAKSGKALSNELLMKDKEGTSFRNRTIYASGTIVNNTALLRLSDVITEYGVVN